MSAGQISFAKQAEAFLKRVRKWDTEFCCIGTKKEAFSVPQPDEVVPRITANLEYFRVNYAICLALFAVVAIIVNPLMLVLVSVFGAAWYGLLTRPSNIKIQMGATLLGKQQLSYCLGGVNAFVVLIFARTVILATVGAAFLFVITHAACHGIPSNAKKGSLDEREDQA